MACGMNSRDADSARLIVAARNRHAHQALILRQPPRASSAAMNDIVTPRWAITSAIEGFGPGLALVISASPLRASNFRPDIPKQTHALPDCLVIIQMTFRGHLLFKTEPCQQVEDLSATSTAPLHQYARQIVAALFCANSVARV